MINYFLYISSKCYSFIAAPSEHSQNLTSFIISYLNHCRSFLIGLPPLPSLPCIEFSVSSHLLPAIVTLLNCQPAWLSSAQVFWQLPPQFGTKLESVYGSPHACPLLPWTSSPITVPSFTPPHPHWTQCRSLGILGAFLLNGLCTCTCSSVCLEFTSPNAPSRMLFKIPRAQ